MHRNFAALVIAWLGLSSLGLPSAGAAAEAPPLRLVNGAVPPGSVIAPSRLELLLRTPAGPGQETLLYRTTRLPGTRTPIHVHDHGGITCLVQGEATMRVEGQPTVRYQAGDCFVMLAGKAMANLNSGTIPAVMLDVFTVPLGMPVWRPVEAGQQGLADSFGRAP